MLSIQFCLLLYLKFWDVLFLLNSSCHSATLIFQNENCCINCNLKYQTWLWVYWLDLWKKDNSRLFTLSLAWFLNLFLSNVSGVAMSWSMVNLMRARYKCRNSACYRCTFIRHYAYRGYLPEVKQQIADMAVNAVRSVPGESFFRPPSLAFEILHECQTLVALVIENIKKKIVISKRSMKFVWLRTDSNHCRLCQCEIWRLKSMRCGVSSVQRNSNVGCGTRLTIRAKNIGVCVVQSSR